MSVNVVQIIKKKSSGDLYPVVWSSRTNGNIRQFKINGWHSPIKDGLSYMYLCFVLANAQYERWINFSLEFPVNFSQGNTYNLH